MFLTQKVDCYGLLARQVLLFKGTYFSPDAMHSNFFPSKDPPSYVHFLLVSGLIKVLHIAFGLSFTTGTTRGIEVGVQRATFIDIQCLSYFALFGQKSPTARSKRKCSAG